MRDWLDDYAPILTIVTLLAGLVWLAVWLVRSDNAAQGAFMAACLKDHKQYECTAMWRAGESHSTTVAVPVVVGR